MAERIGEKNRVVKIGGDEIELPGTMTDEQVKETLRPLYPFINNATPRQAGEVTEYNVEMGTKG